MMCRSARKREPQAILPASFGLPLGDAICTELLLQLVDAGLHVLFPLKVAFVPASGIPDILAFSLPGGVAAIIGGAYGIVSALDVAGGVAGIIAALIDGAIRLGGGENNDEHDGQDQGQGRDNVLHYAAALCSGGWIIRHKQHSFQSEYTIKRKEISSGTLHK